MERIADRPDKRRKMVAWEDYEILKREPKDKGLALDEQELELVIVRKNGRGFVGSLQGFRGARKDGKWPSLSIEESRGKNRI